MISPHRAIGPWYPLELVRAVEILAWDPTHDRPADLRYLTVAVGRDYRDVAPVSGSYCAPHPGSLSASRRIERGGSGARDRRVTSIAARESVDRSRATIFGVARSRLLSDSAVLSMSLRMKSHCVWSTVGHLDRRVEDFLSPGRAPRRILGWARLGWAASSILGPRANDRWGRRTNNRRQACEVKQIGRGAAAHSNQTRSVGA